MRRSWTLGVALLLAACGGTAPASSGAPASAAAKPAEGAIKIGYVVPLTGPTSAVGKDNLDGFNLYLDSVKNTVAGRTIQVLPLDDESNKVDVATARAKQAIENDKVQLIAGLEGTPTVLAVVPIARDARVPVAITGNGGTATLMTDPKTTNPYLTRWTVSITQFGDAVGEWATKQNYRKASILASDYGGGLQVADGTAASFVRHGGAIVQEQYPPMGTADYGPLMAKLDPSADVILSFLPGTDGLRFLQTLPDYAGSRKLGVIDVGNVATSGPNIAQLKDKAVGVVASGEWTEGLESPMNADFQKQFGQKFPGRLLSRDVAEGYAGGQIVAAALQKVSGRIEDTQAFLQALYATDMDTIKGHIYGL
ncbi:MAG TPA: ABC transporter substrate-binding protein [Chloroflexota bacterium]